MFSVCSCAECSSVNSIQLFFGSDRRCGFCHVCLSSISPRRGSQCVNPFLWHISCAPSSLKYGENVSQSFWSFTFSPKTTTSPKVNCSHRRQICTLTFACLLLSRCFISFLFSFFVSKAYLVKGLFFSLPVLTSSRVFNYRLSTRLSPASPTHFYPACRKKHPSREVSAVT